MSKLAQQVQRLVDELHQTPPARSRAAVKRRKRETQSDVIRRVHAEVFLLDPACICGECRPSVKDEMNEVLTRAQSRGLPPEERFNTANCVRMSRKCHHLFHGVLKIGKGLFLRFLDEQLGANGPIEVKRKNGRITIYQRQPSAIAAAALSREAVATPAHRGARPSRRTQAQRSARCQPA